MSWWISDSRLGGITGPLTTVARGRNDPRLRATWRVLLALPLLPLVTLVLPVVMGVLGVGGMIAGGPVQAGIFLVVLAGWSYAIDRRPLTAYGVSLSRPWLLDLLAGFGAVVVAHLLWYGVGITAGWTTIELSLSAPQDLLMVGLVGAVASFGFNAWVQDTVYFAIVLQNAAEGFHSRDLAPTRAAIGGLLVAIAFFTIVHSVSGVVELADYLLAGAVFGVLYLLTGELALTIGVHWGISATAGVVFPFASMTEGSPSVFQVSEALPELVGAVSAQRMPQLVIVLLLLLGWLKWRHGTVTINPSLTHWRERGAGLIGTVTPPLDG